MIFCRIIFVFDKKFHVTCGVISIFEGLFKKITFKLFAKKSRIYYESAIIRHWLMCPALPMKKRKKNLKKTSKF